MWGSYKEQFGSTLSIPTHLWVKLAEGCFEAGEKAWQGQSRVQVMIDRSIKRFLIKDWFYFISTLPMFVTEAVNKHRSF